MRFGKISVFVILSLLFVGVVSAGCSSALSKYGATICDESNSEINLVTANYYCFGGLWKKESNVFKPFTASTLSNENAISCYKEDVEIGSSQDCCPANMQCSGEDIQDTGTVMYCVDSEDPDYVNTCEDIKTESKCNRAKETIAEDEIELIAEDDAFCETVTYGTNSEGEVCYDAYHCRCAWDEEDEECGTYVEKWGTCQETYPSGCIEVASVDDSKCNEPGGFAVYTIKRTPYDGTTTCENTTKTISCSKLTRLGFFGLFNFISVIIILGVVYFKKIRYEK